jgi:3-isopropylmalate dehydrogenase
MSQTTISQQKTQPKSAAKKSSYKIAVLAGDGTGPEVVREGLKVLDAASKKFKFSLNLTPYDLGGERYKRTGEILPETVVGEFQQMDSIFLGAIGHPDVKPGILEKGICAL